MSISNDVISQFVKITYDNNKTEKKETITYGQVSRIDPETNQIYVTLDGTEKDPAGAPKSVIPVTTTVKVGKNDRVIVMIKNHSAVITGNLGNPAVNTEYVDLTTGEIKQTAIDAKKAADEASNKVTEFEIAIGDKLDTKELTAELAKINNLETDTLLTRTVKANEADIDELNTKQANFEQATAEDFEAVNARIDNLDVGQLTVEELKGEFTTIEKLNATDAKVEELQALDANVKALEANKLSAEDAKILYANIDFSNIGEAAVRKLLSDTGLIEDLVVGDGTITGKLVGVTISGDLLEGNTVIAEKLVIKGDDGLYYKLNTDGITTEAEQTDYNSLDGSVIKAKSITATKISVDDLVAFDATIGGFNITTESLYSGAKESVDNSTQGFYADREGQVSLGDGDNYLRYYRDESGNWKLEISAESVLFGSGSKSSAADIKALTEHVKIGTYTDPETNEEQPCVELSEGDSDFKQVITNTKTAFMDGNVERTTIDKDGVSSDKLHAKEESGVGGWVWKERSNGNLGLIWKGGNK